METELCSNCGLEPRASANNICNTCRNRHNRQKRSNIRKRVYFVKSADMVKIGCSIDPHHRYLNLKSSSPVALETIGSIEGDQLLEKMLHDRFRRFNVHGEWFRYDTELQGEIAALIQNDMSLREEYNHYKRQLVEALR